MHTQTTESMSSFPNNKSRKMLWARIVAIVILIAVALVKPRIDSWLGQDTPAATTQAPQSNSSESPLGDAEMDDFINPDDFIDGNSASGNGDSEQDFQNSAPPQQDTATANRNEKPGTSNKAAGAADKTNPGKPGSSTATKTDPPGKLKLVDKARQKFRSTAGLMYVQGSADGHRLKHVLKHAKDIPDKNIHGVFDGDGDRDKILAWIDVAYESGKKGGRGTKVERQGDRTVYTVRMSQRIGYVGGRSGKRSNYPECRYLRLVVENGNEVVTAYPSKSM